MFEQAIGNYDSEKGDSGGPILLHTSNTEAKLVGLHVGKLCATNFDDANPSACESVQLGTKVVSVWENIAEELEIE